MNIDGFLLYSSANTLAYTIFLVAQDDDVDAKLYEELSAIITNEDEPLDLNQIGAMNHLQMALMVGRPFA